MQAKKETCICRNECMPLIVSASFTQPHEGEHGRIDLAHIK